MRQLAVIKVCSTDGCLRYQKNNKHYKRRNPFKISLPIFMEASDKNEHIKHFFERNF